MNTSITQLEILLLEFQLDLKALYKLINIIEKSCDLHEKNKTFIKGSSSCIS